MSTLSGQSNKSFLWWAMFYRTNLNVVQSIPNRDPGCSEAYIKDPEHGASTGSWLYVPEARAVSCSINWPLSMNPGSRKGDLRKKTSVHTWSVVDRPLQLYSPSKIKTHQTFARHRRNWHWTLDGTMLYILFPWGESNPNAESSHSLLVLSPKENYRRSRIWNFRFLPILLQFDTKWPSLLVHLAAHLGIVRTTRIRTPGTFAMLLRYSRSQSREKRR